METPLYKWDLRRAVPEVSDNGNNTMISAAQFTTFVEERVLSVLELFVSQRLAGSKLCAIISWGHYDHDHIYPGTSITHHLIDTPGTDTLRIFFLREGNPFGSLRHPQLIFQLNAAGKLVVSNSLVKYEKPVTFHAVDDTDHLQPSHIYSHIENHFNRMLANIEAMPPVDPRTANLSEILPFWAEQIDLALRTLNSNTTNPLSDLELQVAVGEVFGYDESDNTMIVYHRLNAEELVEYFYQSRFELPEELAVITMEDTILPDDVPGRVDEQRVKVKGEIWKIHKFDKDPCPSNPHAHNVETGYKLHLGTGDLYDSKCHPIYKRVSRAHLIALRERVAGITLPSLTV
jgi:hypothetical protein